MGFERFGTVSFTAQTKVDKFVDLLDEGKVAGTECKSCGKMYFPPRADCLKCLSPDFEFVKTKSSGTLVTFTTIYSAPTGFEDMTPYTLGLIDLDGGGRLLSWFENTKPKDIKIGMKVKVIPRIFEEIEEIKLYYALEKA